MKNTNIVFNSDAESGKKDNGRYRIRAIDNGQFTHTVEETSVFSHEVQSV